MFIKSITLIAVCFTANYMYNNPLNVTTFIYALNMYKVIILT